MSNSRTPSGEAPKINGRTPAGSADSRPRPPGPEEKRGATATSGGNEPGGRQDMKGMLRLPSFWGTLLALLAINWLLVPLLFPESLDRLTVPYTLFKQQVSAGNVAEITSR